MSGLFANISGTMTALVLGLALFGAQRAQAATPEAQPVQLKGADLSPAALQQAEALIEEYVQPIPELAPTPVQQRAIDAAMKLLKSEQATKGQSAIQRFLQVGQAALGELRRLAATAPTEDTTGDASTADAYPATMATIIIRRIETAERQPILDELISLGDNARAVLSLKLDKNEAAAKKVQARIDAATAALIRAATNVTLDSPAVATERDTLAVAQAAQKRVRARHEMLVELRRLLAPKPPVQVAASPQEEPAPATPPASVFDIQPISPPTGVFSYSEPYVWPYGPGWTQVDGGWIPPPPYLYIPPAIFNSPQTANPPFLPSNRPFVPGNRPFQPKSAPSSPTPPSKH
jgi:hypothetical protein